ncbi:hypothetical protein LUR56_21210 [Streptomyces sp. MT29]|nr:hypothetical protein [Streptomyces sp. MT29]
MTDAWSPPRTPGPGSCSPPSPRTNPPRSAGPSSAGPATRTARPVAPPPPGTPDSSSPGSPPRATGRCSGPPPRSFWSTPRTGSSTPPPSPSSYGTRRAGAATSRRRSASSPTATPALPEEQLAEVFPLHPEPVLAALRARLARPGDGAAEVLRALAGLDTPALALHVAGLVRRVHRRPPRGRHPRREYVDLASNTAPPPAPCSSPWSPAC